MPACLIVGFFMGSSCLLCGVYAITFPLLKNMPAGLKYYSYLCKKIVNEY